MSYQGQTQLDDVYNIITEGCVTTGFTLSHSKDHMCCDAFNRTSESHGFSREYDKNTNVPR